MNQLFSVGVLLDFESLDLPTLFYEKKTKKNDNLAVIDKYNFCDKHTDKWTCQTWQSGNKLVLHNQQAIPSYIS